MPEAKKSFAKLSSQRNRNRTPAPAPIGTQLTFRDRRKDGRTRRDRAVIRTQEWEKQREDLVDAYMKWKSGTPTPSSNCEQWTLHTVDLFGE